MHGHGTKMWIGTGVYLDNIVAYKAKMTENIQSQVSKNLTTMLITTGIIFVGIITLCLINVFGLVSALKVMIVNLKDIAEGEGDLTKRIEIKSKDEIAELAGWFNIFIEKLQGIIGSTGHIKSVGNCCYRSRRDECESKQCCCRHGRINHQCEYGGECC